MPAAKKAVKKSTRKVAKTVKPSSAKFTSVRKSLSAGTVAIMLAGRFRGKRVIVLKQLEKNGPMVVTGPYKYNGVPLRRVDARYVIATSTKVDVSAVDASKVTKALFTREKVAKAAKGEKDFMGKEKNAKKTEKASGKKGPNGGKVSDARLAIQKSVDTAVIAALKKDPLGKEKAGYLRSVFTVKPGDMPHRMKF